MKIKGTGLVLLLITLCLIVADVEAGWKFWKKDKDTTTTTTTVAPNVANPEPPKVTPAPSASTTAKAPGSPTNAGSAIIGAGNPGLAIGVGSTGQDIRNNARPQRPNPGTEVGLDTSGPKPGRPGTGGQSGQGYRDWAVDLTGAGEPGRQPPRLPSEGPAVGSGGSRPASQPGAPSQPQPGSRPASVPGSAPSQPQPAGARPTSGPGITPAPQPQSPGSRQPLPGSPGGTAPGSTPHQPPAAAGQGQPISNQGGPGGNQVSTLNVGPLRPAGVVTPTPPRPASPGSPGSPASPGSPGSPGRTWADVAGGGSRPNSPTPSPRQPGYPNQPAPGQPQPRPATPYYPGQTRPSAGTIAAGGALAGGALAGGAVAGGALAGGSSAGSGSAGRPSTGATNPTGKTYSSNPTYSKGSGITDEDLEKLAEALFIKDSNNANRHITLNLQKQTSSSSINDEAPNALFSVNAEAYQIPTIQRVISIFDNYQLETHTNEHISPQQREEESLLVDTFLSTNVMSAAMRFLADKGKLRKDYYEYKDTLRKIWFNLFSRGQGKIGSTGFEHVFMVELKPAETVTEVIGLHNWIYFSKEEKTGRADYHGYMKKVDLGNKASIIKFRTKFNGHAKPVTTMFVGTSPELEMALYTVCFYARPDGNCPLSLGGTKFNIVTHKFKYRGNDLVGTAYPDI